MCYKAGGNAFSDCVRNVCLCFKGLSSKSQDRVFCYYLDFISVCWTLPFEMLVPGILRKLEKSMYKKIRSDQTECEYFPSWQFKKRKKRLGERQEWRGEDEAFHSGRILNKGNKYFSSEQPNWARNVVFAFLLSTRVQKCSFPYVYHQTESNKESESIIQIRFSFPVSLSRVCQTTIKWGKDGEILKLI